MSAERSGASRAVPGAVAPAGFRSSPMSASETGRWVDIDKALLRGGPLATAGFEPCEELKAFLQEQVSVLCVGAGGLGCELLKDLALSGFRNIHVIDMDTIDVSNLNRQFLFRQSDVGKPKATVAAEFVNKRVAGCSVTPHYCKIQDKDAEFYRSFTIVVCGLDSVGARRWMNGMLCGLVEHDEEGNVRPETIIPMVDGGTEVGAAPHATCRFFRFLLRSSLCARLFAFLLVCMSWVGGSRRGAARCGRAVVAGLQGTGARHLSVHECVLRVHD